MAYTLRADECPSNPSPAATYLLSDCSEIATSAPRTEGYAQGQTSVVPPKLNREALRVDYASAFGGLGFGVLSGLTITSAGLTVSVTAGSAMIYGLVQTAGASAVVLDDQARIYLWLKGDGTLQAVNNSLTPPTSDCAYLGSFVSAAGSVTGVDYSGVAYLKPSGAIRYTADTAKPTDSPGACVLLTSTVSGLYLWDGAYHRALGNSPDYGSVDMAADANKTLTAAQFTNAVLEIYTTVPLTVGRDVVCPNWKGAARDLYNHTTQDLTFKVAGQAGTTIASGKRARVYCDGTDIVRLSSDI